MTKEQAKLCYISILIGIILTCLTLTVGLTIYDGNFIAGILLLGASFIAAFFITTPITVLVLDLILQKNNHAYVLLSGDSEGEIFLGIYRNLYSARKALTKISITKKFKEVNQDYWESEDRLSYYSIGKEQIQ